ncbi:MAG: rhomboid family intramembrane serine protease [Chloroflexi bacterium]|nr:rhomboid family intramembrane serine protease [Chloroflexota bacterium]
MCCRRINRDGCPATLCLLAGAVVLFLAVALDAPSSVLKYIIFDPARWLTRPWTLVTGSLYCTDTLSLLFAAAWLWVCGGSLERSLGTRTFVGLWCVLSAATGLGLYLGWLATGHDAPLFFFAVLDAVTVVWALMNRGQVVMLMFVLPVSSQLLAGICVLFTLVLYRLPLGLFALTGCLLALGFVLYRERRRRYRGVTRVPARRPGQTDTFNPLSRLQAWQRNRRVRKLFRDSDVDGRDRTGRL